MYYKWKINWENVTPETDVMRSAGEKHVQEWSFIRHKRSLAGYRHRLHTQTRQKPSFTLACHRVTHGININ